MAFSSKTTRVSRCPMIGYPLQKHPAGYILPLKIIPPGWNLHVNMYPTGRIIIIPPYEKGSHPFLRTTSVSRHQKGKSFWILLAQEMTGWQWHVLDHMQIICTSLQTDSMPVPHHSVFTVRMPFLPPNEQHRSTDGKNNDINKCVKICLKYQKIIKRR